MALAVAVKMNTSLRCLDLNIPPNDPDFARLSQDILQSCARNTEAAQAEAVARGTTIPVAAPMLKSAVARELNTRQEVEAVKAERQAKREEEWGVLLSAAEETHQVLFEVVKEDEAKKSPAPDGRVVCGELARELVDQAKAYQIQLTETMKGMKIGELKGEHATLFSHAGVIADFVVCRSSDDGQRAIGGNRHARRRPLLRQVFTSPTAPSRLLALAPPRLGHRRRDRLSFVQHHRRRFVRRRPPTTFFFQESGERVEVGLAERTRTARRDGREPVES